MRRIDLDLVARRARWPAWLMAALGALAALDAGATWAGLRERERQLTAQGTGAAARMPQRPAMSERTRREFDAAQRLLAELAEPWEPMFRAIEGALDNDTALLAIEPDASKHVVQISGEARGYAAILRFMDRLEKSGALVRVHLLNHEVRDEAPERPTGFTLLAHWRTSP